MAKHVGPSGSGADMADAMSKLEAAPASHVVHGVIHWHLRTWPEIARLVEDWALDERHPLSVSILRQTAAVLGRYLYAQGSVDDRQVSDYARRFMALPVRQRRESIRAIGLLAGARQEILGLCEQVEEPSARNLLSFIAQAMIVSRKLYPATDIEDGIGRYG